MTDANYSQLVQLYDEYHTQGLEILAFPCNQFMGQEPVSVTQNTLFETCGKVDVRLAQLTNNPSSMYVLSRDPTKRFFNLLPNTETPTKSLSGSPRGM